jgi:hypothetical protein
MRSRNERLLFGHLWAMFAASTLLFVLLFGKAGWMLISFSLLSFFEVLALHPVASFFVWLIIAACTFFTGTIPLGAAILIAEYFSIRNVWYYVLSGVPIGMAATPAFVLVTWSSSESLSFFERYIRAVPLVVLCSVFGCLVFWWKAGRWAGATAEARSALPTSSST